MSEQNSRFSRYRDGAIASILCAQVMPNMEVSERTQRTYDIGAIAILNQLMSGEWRFGSQHTEIDRQLLGEFFERITANAQTQGINLGLRPEALEAE